MLIKSKHLSVLEHGTVYLKIPFKHVVIKDKELDILNSKYRNNHYSKLKCITKRKTDNPENIGNYITTNLRVLQENNWMKDLQFLCEPTEFHEKRLSVKVVTSRSISHELVRHRSMSFIQESQRYVGYTKDKFGGEITYIIPSWSSLPLGTVLLLPKNSQESVFCIRQDNVDSPVVIPDENGNLEFLEVCAASEREYRCLINHGFKPQEAREVLPNATKTTLVITAFESDWREWFAQRLFGKTGTPHPDMLVLANLIKEEFEKAGVWEGIMKYPSKYE
jgi:thymidylate synthase (FAD)